MTNGKPVLKNEKPPTEIMDMELEKERLAAAKRRVEEPPRRRITDPTWRVVSPVWNLRSAMTFVAGAIPTDGQLRKALDRALHELNVALEVSFDADQGLIRFENQREKAEYLFSELAVYGIQEAMVQFATGVSTGGKPAPVGSVQNDILPTARVFRIEKKVKEKAKLEESVVISDLGLEADDEGEAEEKKE